MIVLTFIEFSSISSPGCILGFFLGPWNSSAKINLTWKCMSRVEHNNIEKALAAFEHNLNFQKLTITFYWFLKMKFYLDK